MTVKQKRSWLLVFFGAIFLSAGSAIFLWSTVPALYDGWRMQSWSSTEAKLLSANLDSSTSDGSTTYTATARYQYFVNGHLHENDRVAIHLGGDNIGDFQTETGHRLESYFASNKAVTVYYDPDSPNDSVLVRDQRWELIGFKTVFFLTFGGVGAVIIFFGLRGRRVNTAPAVQGKLWLEKPEWANNDIRSSAKTGMYFMWGFAIFWNLVSSPLLFNVEEIYRDEGLVVLVALIFPLIGLGLLAYAIKLSLQWRRFGVTPLRMDPFPGAIGGDVGGEIKVNLRYDPRMRCDVTLSCIHSYVSGSGKNRSRRESIKWQDSGYAKIIPGSNSVRLQFRFTVPEGLPQSEQKSDSYYLWRLDIESELPGTDLSRSFEIPVFDVDEKQSSLVIDSVSYQPAGMVDSPVESLLPIVNSSPSSLELYYPMMRKPITSLMGIVFGGLFAGTGIFLWIEAAQEGFMLYIMSAVFSLFGGIICIAGIYSLFNSLRVRFDGKAIHVVRKFMGLSLKKLQLPYSSITDITTEKGSSSTQKGSKHQIQYDVIAHTAEGKFVLAEHLTSHSKAMRVVEYFQQRIGIESVSLDFE